MVFTKVNPADPLGALITVMAWGVVRYNSGQGENRANKHNKSARYARLRHIPKYITTKCGNYVIRHAHRINFRETEPFTPEFMLVQPPAEPVTFHVRRADIQASRKMTLFERYRATRGKAA